MSGPPRKPVALKLLEGNRGHQSQKILNKGPDWHDSFGPCPKHLKGEARKLWKKLVPQLASKNLAAEVYRPALEGLCRNYARALQAEAILDSQGLTMSFQKSEDGTVYEQQRPEVSIAQKSWQAVKAFAAEFGLTPAAVSKIQMPTKKERSLDDHAKERANAVRSKSG